jgi:hypothetical protein
MVMPAVEVPTCWTAEMVRALPDDGKRHETVYGELLVTPSPRMRHDIVGMRLHEVLRDYFAHEPVGVAMKAIFGSLRAGCSG